MARHRERGNTSANGMIGLLVGVLVGSVALFGAVKGVGSLGGQGTPSTSARPSSSSQGELSGCDTTTTVKVVAPAVVVPMLKKAAEASCAKLSLTQSQGRAGVDASESADLWVTDSSTWSEARKTRVRSGTSIASSPLVGVVNPATSADFGKSGMISWPTLLSPDRSVKLGFFDPSATATGLLAAWPVLRAQRELSTAPYEALALTATALTQPAAVGEPVLQAPPNNMLLFAGEYLARPSATAEVLRGQEGEPYLDFPAYNVATDPAVRTAVDALITALASPDLAEERAAAQLREPDGTAGFDTTALGSATERMPLPNHGSTIKLYGLSTSGSIPGRILVLLDVSESMGAIQPDGSRLFDTVRTNALLAMATLLDHTSVGVWLYGTGVDGAKDHRELVPISPLGESRDRIEQEVQAVDVVPGSQSSTFETILAGYHELQDGYDPSAAQSLVVFTNGAKEPGAGLGVDSLITQLKKDSKPEEHIRVMGVGFGADADADSLKKISREIGGTSSRVQSPVQMLGLFITMVGQVAAQG